MKIEVRATPAVRRSAGLHAASGVASGGRGRGRPFADSCVISTLICIIIYLNQFPYKTDGEHNSHDEGKCDEIK